MLEGRSGDEDGVDIGRGQQLFEVGVFACVVGLDGGFGFVELIRELIAEGHHFGARIGIGDTGVVGAAAAAADQADGDLRIGLRASNRLWGHNGEGACGSGGAREETATSGLWFHERDYMPARGGVLSENQNNAGELLKRWTKEL